MASPKFQSSPRDLEPGPRERVRLALLIGALCAVAIVFRAPYFNGLPGRGGWVWPYQLAKVWTYADLAFIFSLAGFVVSTALWIGGRRRYRALSLLFLFAVWACGYAIVGPGARLLPYHFLHRVRGGYFESVSSIRLSDFLGSYPLWQQGSTPFGHTHPPGISIFFRGLMEIAELWPGGARGLVNRFEAWGVVPPASLSERAFAGVLLWSYLSPLFALSAVLPLWLTARRLGGGRHGALAVLIFGLVPAPMFFIAQVEQLLLVFAAWSLYLALRPGRGAAFAAGIVAGAAIHLSYGMLSHLALIALVVTLGRFRPGKPLLRALDYRLLIADLGLLGAGVVVTWLPLLLWPDFSVVDAYRESVRFHQSWTGGRPWWKYLWFNLSEFALLQNPVMLIFFLGSLPRILKNLAGGKLEPTAAPALALAAIILLLDCSRLTSGETGRIWMFLAPALIVPTAGEWGNLPPRPLAAVSAAAAGVYALILLQLYSV